MSIRFKIDILDALKAAGWSTYRIRAEKKLAQSTLTKIRAGKWLSEKELDTICRLLDLQPGDILERVDDP
jgi:putative transcriptional regulator